MGALRLQEDAPCRGDCKRGARCELIVFSSCCSGSPRGVGWGRVAEWVRAERARAEAARAGTGEAASGGNCCACSDRFGAEEAEDEYHFKCVISSPKSALVTSALVA